MKKHGLYIGVVLFAFACLAGLTQARAGWWDKGASIIENLGVSGDGIIKTAASSQEIGDAFKEALRIGTENVVGRLGAVDGFNSDPAIHIPLPGELNTAKTMLSKLGMSQLVDDLELKMNRAAEAATPKAKDLFLQAISDMTFEDVKNIYEGPEDSATRYFKSKMSPPLAKDMKPIVDQTMSQVGAVQAYDQVMGEYRALPFVPDVKANLTDHVLEKGIDGIFHYIAIEEASIRKDPAKQTTALLKKVFGEK